MHHYWPDVRVDQVLAEPALPVLGVEDAGVVTAGVVLAQTRVASLHLDIRRTYLHTSLVLAFAKVCYPALHVTVSDLVECLQQGPGVQRGGGAGGHHHRPGGSRHGGARSSITELCSVYIVHCELEMEMVPGGAPSVQWLRTRDAAARPRPAETGDW